MVVSDLLKIVELGLTVVAGGDHLDSPVQWAHVSELVDPTQYLEGGELLLLTGLNLPPGRLARKSYVDRLVTAGVSALGFGVGLSEESVPSDLAEASDAAGLALLEVPRSTPFLAVSKAVSSAITTQELLSSKFITHAQHKMTTAVTGAGGLSALLVELTRLTSSWGLLLDSSGEVLAASPARAGAYRDHLRIDLDKLARSAGIASLSSVVAGGEAWLQSLTVERQHLGFLALGKASAFAEPERRVVGAAIPLFVLALDRSHLLEPGRRTLETSVLRLLCSGERDLVEAVAADLWSGLPEEPVTVVVWRGSRYGLSAVRNRLKSYGDTSTSPVLYGHLNETVVCIAPTSVPPVSQALAALGQMDRVHAGVSEPGSYDQLPGLLGQAGRAASYAESERRPAIRFGEMPRLGLLDLAPPSAAADFAESVLRRIDSQVGQRELLRSLQVWLAHHGQWDPAAAELGVHRHTLRNRVRKVEAILGRRLDSADLRAEIWVALRLREHLREGPDSLRGSAAAEAVVVPAADDSLHKSNP